MQEVTAEYGPARAQKKQTGKWYPQIPVDHTTLQINQRVVNTTLIPVKCGAPAARSAAGALPVAGVYLWSPGAGLAGPLGPPGAGGGLWATRAAVEGAGWTW